jgi:uncharacterized protein (DUF433 family)
MDWRDHIDINDEIMNGKPVLKGTRISIEHVIKLLASGWSEQDILENYPRLNSLSLQAVFQYMKVH